MGQYEKAIVLSDLHIPFQDEKAVELVFRFIRDFNPEYVFLDGDVLDCFEISRFNQPIDLGKHLKDELAETRLFFTRLRGILPDAKIIYIEGNHEKRFNKYIWEQAEELWGLDGLSIQEQLRLKDFKIDYIDSVSNEAWYKYGHLYIGHFGKCNKHGGYTAKSLLDDKGVSLIQGHTHRLAEIHRRLLDKEIVGIENGCLCNLTPFYINNPNWQLGFTVLYKKIGKNRVHAYPIVIWDYRFYFGNKEYFL
jgi:predicted phosphodiesterase